MGSNRALRDCHFGSRVRKNAPFIFRRVLIHGSAASTECGRASADRCYAAYTRIHLCTYEVRRQCPAIRAAFILADLGAPWNRNIPRLWLGHCEKFSLRTASWQIAVSTTVTTCGLQYAVGAIVTTTSAANAVEQPWRRIAICVIAATTAGASTMPSSASHCGDEAPDLTVCK